MAEAQQRGVCDTCESEVDGVKNPHRARNMVAASFAAANFSLLAADPRDCGATTPYVCPHCGDEVKPLGEVVH